MNTPTEENPLAHECPQCGSIRLSERLVKSAIWHGDRLVVVEGIPAIVCDDCGERFYDDATATLLELMYGDGFPPDRAVANLSVPIYTFSHRVPAELIETAEDEA